MAKLNADSFFKAPLKLDGADITVKIGRLTIEAFTTYEHRFLRYGTPPPGVTVAVEGAGEMTPERRAEAEGRALAALEAAKTPAQREAEDAAAVEALAALAAFMRESFEAYVRFAPGEIDVDGHAVETGGRFLDFFGGRTPVCLYVLGLIWSLNRLPEDARKKLTSPSGSLPTSDAPGPEARGPRPDPTAAPAAPGASVGTGAATTAPPSAASPSGGTTT